MADAAEIDGESIVMSLWWYNDVVLGGAVGILCHWYK